MSGARYGNLRHVPDDVSGLRAPDARLRWLLAGRDAEVAALRAELDASLQRERRLKLWVAELERRLGMDSSDSGTSSPRERIGAKEARRARQQSERERSTDRKSTPPLPAREEEEKDPDEREKPAAGAPHVLIVRTPDGRLTWLQAIASRHKAAIAASLPALFTGALIADGYAGYQHLSRLAGIQQCCAHVIRRCRAGIVHNRLRDWDSGNHPGYALGCWLRDYKEQVFLFTRDFAVAWTNNVSERGAISPARSRESLATTAPRRRLAPVRCTP